MEARRDRGGPAFLGDALRSFLKESGLGAQMRDWKVFDAWREVLGPELAQRARAVAFRRGELVVEVGHEGEAKDSRRRDGRREREGLDQCITVGIIVGPPPGIPSVSVWLYTPPISMSVTLCPPRSRAMMLVRL